MNGSRLIHHLPISAAAISWAVLLVMTGRAVVTGYQMTWQDSQAGIVLFAVVNAAWLVIRGQRECRDAVLAAVADSTATLEKCKRELLAAQPDARLLVARTVEEMEREQFDTAEVVDLRHR